MFAGNNKSARNGAVSNPRLLKCVALLVSVLMASTAAADIESLGEFDPNNDGKICRASGSTTDEVPAFLRRVAAFRRGAEIYGEADKNGDGLLDPVEASNFSDLVVQEAEALEVDFNDLWPSQDCVEVVALDNEWIPKKNPPVKLGEYEAELADGRSVKAGPVLIRSEFTDVKVTTKPKALKDAKGALISYKRDFEAGDDVFTAKGALIYPYTIQNTPRNAAQDCSKESGPIISAYSILPSIEFDRVTNAKEKSNDVNQLTPRLGGQVVLCGGPLFDRQFITGSVAMVTDFDLEAAVPTVEAEWEPRFLPLGLGGAIPFFDDLVSIGWTGSLALKYSNVIDAGGNTKITKNDTLFIVGPRLGLDIWVDGGPLEGLHAYADWDYFRGLADSPTETQLLSLGIEYPLDPNEQFFISVDYRDGDTPILQQNAEDLTLGFRLKF